ncbi:MAG: sigma-70 family RNA polymerase sigma factor [Cyanobacteria bacterium J06626_18]
MNNPVYEIRFLGWEGCQWLYCFSLHRSIPWWSWFGKECTCYVSLYAFIEQTQCLISSQEGQQGILLLAFFEAKIRQFHVTQHLSPEDVLGEAILRGVKFIRKQAEPIHSPSAWLRRTGYNIVRETYRRHRQERSLDDYLELKAPEPESIEPDERLPGLNQALIQLPEGDRRMLIWHYVENCSWREIANRVDSTEMAVRQRGHRAKSRLLKALKG